MTKNIRWKVLTILVVTIIFFGVGVYPILAGRYHLPAPGWLMAKQLRLGLDLQGGVHLVMRVHTDDALRIRRRRRPSRCARRCAPPAWP